MLTFSFVFIATFPPEAAVFAPAILQAGQSEPTAHAYLCNQMRRAERSCSVFTGFARYSEAPASKHFSRSPFMALAVRAIIGKRRNMGFCRITCMVS